MSSHTILMVNDDLEVGGVQRLVVEFANRMIERDVAVGVLAAPGGPLWGDLIDEVRVHGDDWRSGRGIVQRVLLALSLRRVVRRGSYNIVHAHQRGVSLAARIGLLGTGVRVVEHVHSEFYSSRIGAQVSFRGHHLIACGGAVLRMLTDRYGRAAERVTLVRNSITDIWSGEPLELPSSSSEGVRVVAVGSLLEVKDPLRFVRVMNDVSARCPNVSAEWVGDGPLRGDVDRLVGEVRFGPNFSGPSNEVKQRILAADVLMLTSKREGLPLVVLEAMALGRPVIAPDVGSCGDVVETDMNGILYPKDSSDGQLVETVIGCLDVSKLEQWGAVSRKKFEAMGDLSRVVDEVIEVYDRVRV